MSSGSITTGSSTGDFYSHKEWSGANGKYQADGTLKENPYSCIGNTMSRSGAVSTNNTYCRNGRVTYPLKTYVNCGCGSALPSKWESNDDNKLAESLANKVFGHKFDAGVFAGELRESSRMAFDSARQIGRAMIDLKRGNLSGVATALSMSISGSRRKRLTHKDISSAWLSLQMGWLPLISDVYEAFDAFERSLESSDEDVRYVVRGTKAGDSFESSCSPANWSGTGQKVTRKQIIFKGKESYGMTQSLGLSNPANIAWNLMPWTFAIDYFVPIGTFLNAARLQGTLQGTFVTSAKEETNRRFTGLKPVISTAVKCIDTSVKPYRINTFPSIVGGGSYQASSFTFGRSIGTQLRYSPPALRTGLSGKQLLNLIALVHQKISR